MEPVPLRKLVEVTRGRWLSPLPPKEALVTEISTDSRTLPESSIFVALRGERFDGHAYVGEARRRGALASIVSRARSSDLPSSDGPYIGVDDPLDALERIAAWNRDRLRLTVIGVTGSVGKTSTKEFLATILADGFRVRSAPKSFNNRIGVATTLISATPDTEVLIVEMGTSAPGELSHLTRVVRPHRIVLTEIAPAHLAGFGDLDGVVRAKAEIFEGIEPGGVAFLRHGVHGFECFAGRSRGPVYTFGWSEGDFAVTDCQRVSLGKGASGRGGHGDYGYLFTVNGKENFLLPVPGRHNVLNAVASIAVARDLGMRWEQIRSSVANCRLPPLRLQVREAGGVVFVDDSYNASPASMEAAIEEWASLGNEAEHSSGGNGGKPAAGAGESPLVAVLGDMLEMGSESRRLHQAIGDSLTSRKARLLVTVGADSRWIAEAYRAAGGSAETAHFESAVESLPYLKGRLRDGDHVLFKASRRIGLDTVVSELRKWLVTRLASSR